MTIKQALEILYQHQKWRLGLTNEMPFTPKELTQALDTILKHFEHDNL